MTNEKEFKPGDICRFVLTGEKCMVVNIPLLDKDRYDVRLLSGEERRVYHCEIEAWVDPKLDTKHADSIIDQLKEYIKGFRKDDPSNPAKCQPKKTNPWIKDPWDDSGPKIVPLLGK